MAAPPATERHRERWQYWLRSAGPSFRILRSSGSGIAVLTRGLKRVPHPPWIGQWRSFSGYLLLREPLKGPRNAENPVPSLALVGPPAFALTGYAWPAARNRQATRRAPCSFR